MCVYNNIIYKECNSGWIEGSLQNDANLS